MLSDSSFEFFAAMEEGCEYHEMYRLIGQYRSDIEHYSDPLWDYEAGVIEDLRVATMNALSGEAASVEQLTHIARLVTWRYDIWPDHPWSAWSWSEFKSHVGQVCLYHLSRTPQIEASSRDGLEHLAGTTSTKGPSEDFIKAELNSGAVEMRIAEFRDASPPPKKARRPAKGRVDAKKVVAKNAANQTSCQ